jgi:hypothetical protein
LGLWASGSREEPLWVVEAGIPESSFSKMAAGEKEGDGDEGVHLRSPSALRR